MKYLILLSSLFVFYSSFGQILISPSVEVVKTNRVKQLNVYKTKLADSLTTKSEYLRLVYGYDTLGRRISVMDYHNNKLIAKQKFYYADNSKICSKSEYIQVRETSLTDTVAWTEFPQPGDIMDCQRDIYSFESKFTPIYNSSGLLSTIISYSKLVLNKNFDGSGRIETMPYSKEIEMNEPQYILRLEYVYY